jgi:pimeloyl-ACP methyl ester carboxylesterase
MTDYDPAARAHDDIAVLDHLGVSKAVFVGHSVAGSELSAIAVKYGHRVQKLVYLDAFDLSRRFQVPDIPPAPYTEKDSRSLPILLAASQRLEDILRPAQEVCFAVQFDKDGMIMGSTTPAWVPAAILTGAQEPTTPPMDWAKVEAPRLGIFSQPSVQGRLAYYWYLSAKDKKKFDENWPGIVKWYADTTDEFAAEQSGRPKPVVYRVPNAPHYFYLNDQAFVVRVMREFLLGKVEP